MYLCWNQHVSVKIGKSISFSVFYEQRGAAASEVSHQSYCGATWEVIHQTPPACWPHHSFSQTNRSPANQFLHNTDKHLFMQNLKSEPLLRQPPMPKVNHFTFQTWWLNEQVCLHKTLNCSFLVSYIKWKKVSKSCKVLSRV